MIEAARQSSDEVTLARETWRAMLAVTMGGESHTRMHDVCQAMDLTPAALKILMGLTSGPRPMRELVETFRHDPSYLTSVVDFLERRGLARREPHPTDRRAKTVVLTEQGADVLAQALELLTVPPRSLGVLTLGEQKQLLGLLMRLLAAEPTVPDVMRPRVPSSFTPTA